MKCDWWYNHFIQYPICNHQPMRDSPQDGPPIEDRLLQQRCALSQCQERIRSLTRKRSGRHISPHLVLPAGHIYIYKYYTLYVWYNRLYIMNINIFYNYAWEQIQVYDVSVYVSLCHPLKSLINVNWSTVSWCSTKAEVVGFLRSQCHFPYGQRTAYTGTAECEAKTIPSAKNPKIMKIHAWCISHTSHQAFHSIDQSFWCRMSFKSTGPP